MICWGWSLALVALISCKRANGVVGLMELFPLNMQMV